MVETIKNPRAKSFETKDQNDLARKIAEEKKGILASMKDKLSSLVEKFQLVVREVQSKDTVSAVLKGLNGIKSWRTEVIFTDGAKEIGKKYRIFRKFLKEKGSEAINLLDSIPIFEGQACWVRKDGKMVVGTKEDAQKYEQTIQKELAERQRASDEAAQKEAEKRAAKAEAVQQKAATEVAEREQVWQELGQKYEGLKTQIGELDVEIVKLEGGEQKNREFKSFEKWKEGEVADFQVYLQGLAAELSELQENLAEKREKISESEVALENLGVVIAELGAKKPADWTEADLEKLEAAHELARKAINTAGWEGNVALGRMEDGNKVQNIRGWENLIASEELIDKVRAEIESRKPLQHPIFGEIPRELEAAADNLAGDIKYFQSEIEQLCEDSNLKPIVKIEKGYTSEDGLFVDLAMEFDGQEIIKLESLGQEDSSEGPMTTFNCSTNYEFFDAAGMAKGELAIFSNETIFEIVKHFRENFSQAGMEFFTQNLEKNQPQISELLKMATQKNSEIQSLRIGVNNTIELFLAGKPTEAIELPLIFDAKTGQLDLPNLTVKLDEKLGIKEPEIETPPELKSETSDQKIQIDNQKKEIQLGEQKLKFAPDVKSVEVQQGRLVDVIVIKEYGKRDKIIPYRESDDIEKMTKPQLEQFLAVEGAEQPETLKSKNGKVEVHTKEKFLTIDGQRFNFHKNLDARFEMQGNRLIVKTLRNKFEINCRWSFVAKRRILDFAEPEKSTEQV